MPQRLSEVQKPLKLSEVSEPTASPTRGFWNNLRLPWSSVRDMMGSPAGGAAKEGFFHDALKALTSRGEKPDRLEKWNASVRSIDANLRELEEAGLEGSEQYLAEAAKLDRTIELQEKEEVSEFSFGSLVSAFKEDSGAVAAEIANAVMADPVLMATPLGARRVAAKAAAAVATRGRMAQTMARVAGGSLGAGATGAAVAMPLSVADQAAKDGTVNWGDVWNDMAMTGAISAPIGGLVGASSLPAVLAKVPKAVPEHPSLGAAAATVMPSSMLEEAVSDMLAGPKRLAKEIGDFVGRKSVTYLDEASKASPSLRQIRNLFEYEEFSSVPIAPSFYERVYLANGKFMSRLQDSIESLSSMFSRRITKAVNDDILEDLRGIKKASGQSGEVSKQLRGLLDDVRLYADESGLDVGYIENYFPRVYKADKVLKEREKFVGLLSKYMPIEEADTIARKIAESDGVLAFDRNTTTRLVNESGEFVSARVGEPSKPSKNANVEMSRKLVDVPDEQLAPYLEDNVYDALRKYVMGVTRRSEYARAFGKGEGKLNRLLRNAIAEGAEAGRPLTRKEISRVYELADAVQLNYKPIQSKVMHDLNKGVGTYQLLRTLSLATVSSLSEPLIILERGRIGSTAKALPKVLSHAVSGLARTVFKRFPKAEATRALENVGVGLDIGVTERLMASFGGETSRVTNAFFKATMLHQWTRMNRVAGFHAGRQMVIDNLKDLSSGVKGARGKRYLQELAELGVDVNEGLSWVARGMPEADDFKKTLDAAALRFTNEVVMDPRATNRPMWHSNPHVHLFSQLKGFQTVFGNTVMKRWLHKIFESSDKTYHAAKIGVTGALMVLTAMIANDFREKVKYGPEGNPRFKNEPVEARVLRGLDRVGFTGVGQFAVDAVYAHRFGSSGFTQMFGPTASQTEHMLRGIGQALEGDTSKLELELANAVPIANTYKPARDRMREVFEEALD